MASTLAVPHAGGPVANGAPSPAGAKSPKLRTSTSFGRLTFRRKANKSSQSASAAGEASEDEREAAAEAPRLHRSPRSPVPPLPTIPSSSILSLHSPTTSPSPSHRPLDTAWPNSPSIPSRHSSSLPPLSSSSPSPSASPAARQSNLPLVAGEEHGLLAPPRPAFFYQSSGKTPASANGSTSSFQSTTSGYEDDPSSVSTGPSSVHSGTIPSGKASSSSSGQGYASNMHRLIRRNGGAHKTAPRHNDVDQGYLSEDPAKAAAPTRKFDSARRASDKAGGYISSGEQQGSTSSRSAFRSLGRKFFRSPAAVDEFGVNSNSSASDGRSGSYSSESTAHSSPPRTPTTPTTPLNLGGKDALSLSLSTGGLLQLPPLSALAADGAFLSSNSDAAAGKTGSESSAARSDAAATKSKPALSVTVPTPAKLHDSLREPSPRVTAAPLPPTLTASPTSPTAPNGGATSTASANGTSLFANSSLGLSSAPAPSDSLVPATSGNAEISTDTSDFLKAVLSFSEGGSLFDGPDSSSSALSASYSTPSGLPAAPPSSAFNARALNSSYSLRHPTSPSRGLPRLLTEAQLAELAEEERTKKVPSSRYGFSRPKLTIRPGLFGRGARKGESSDSEDEYGDDDQDKGTDEAADDASSATTKGTATPQPSPNEPGNKRLPDLMNKASSFLKPKANEANTSASPSNPDAATFPSSLALGKKSRSPSPRPINSAALQPTSLPGLNTPAKRALYACTLLKVHPQLHNIMKVGVTPGQSNLRQHEVPGSIEIRFPRSINSSPKLAAASKLGGTQTGVAGAPITLGSRRLDVALAQTKVMRKLRRRLIRKEEVEIGWFLQSYASELVSPEIIAKSLAAKPQVSPEALAKPLVAADEQLTSAQEGCRPDSPDSVLPSSPASKTAGAGVSQRVSSQPNGLTVWASRKPFLERCVMIRGENEETFTVGDVVVNAEEASTAIPHVSAETFQVGQIVSQPKHQSLKLEKPRQTARAGDLVFSPRIRVLAGWSPKPPPFELPKTKSQRQKKTTSSAKRTPAPWEIPRPAATKRSSTMPLPRSDSNDSELNVHAHIQAAHDKLTRRGSDATGDAHRSAMSPAQALVAQTRARESAFVGTTAPVAETEEEEAVEALSGGEYASAVDSDDDNLPIAALATMRRQSNASTAFQRRASEAAPSSNGHGHGDDLYAGPASAAEQRERERIARLEQEVADLRQREMRRESVLAMERQRLAQIKAQQRAAQELEEQKRRLRAARERRSKTDHSEVLQAHNYGAGDAAWFERSGAGSSCRRLKQSSSMVDIHTSSTPGVRSPGKAGALPGPSTSMANVHDSLGRRGSQQMAAKVPRSPATPPPLGAIAEGADSSADASGLLSPNSCPTLKKRVSNAHTHAPTAASSAQRASGMAAAKGMPRDASARHESAGSVAGHGADFSAMTPAGVPAHFAAGVGDHGSRQGHGSMHGHGSAYGHGSLNGHGSMRGHGSAYGHGSLHGHGSAYGHGNLHGPGMMSASPSMQHQAFYQMTAGSRDSLPVPRRGSTIPSPMPIPPPGALPRSMSTQADLYGAGGGYSMPHLPHSASQQQAMTSPAQWQQWQQQQHLMSSGFNGSMQQPLVRLGQHEVPSSALGMRHRDV